MSDHFYRRLSLGFGFLAIIAIFAMQGFMANLEIKDLDLWLHLGMGRHIVENGFQVPTVDILSCTVAGTPWINHEWLFQVIVYLIYRAQGPDGLILMQVILVAATSLILFLLGYNRNRQFAAAVLFLFVALLYQVRFTIRPDLYSLFFSVTYILLLYTFLRSKWSILAFFIVQVLWSNIHGFFFLGPALMLVVLLSEWLKRHVPLPWEWNHISRLTNVEYRHLKQGIFAALLACLLNPLTFRGAWYPVWVFFQISSDSSIFFNYITELKRPITMATLFTAGEYVHYKLLILVSFVTFVFNRRRIDLGSLFFWVIFLIFSLAAVRNIVYFAFAAYLISMKNIAAISMEEVIPVEIHDKKFVYLLSMILKIFLMIWVVRCAVEMSGNGYFDFDRYERKSEFLGVSQRSYPDKAVDFLVENRVRGNIFNEFNSGAYLVGRCFPDIRVYIDGRTEVYGPDFFKHHLRIVHDHDMDVLADDLERFDISIVLLNTSITEVPKKVLEFFYQHPEWELVYLDYDGCIFLKDIPDHQEVIRAKRINPAQWETQTLDEFRLGSRKVVPYRNLYRAQSLFSLGYPGQARDECAAALRIYPGYPEVFALLGWIYENEKDYEEAFHYFRLAVSYDSHERSWRTGMARMYEKIGRYDEALRHYRIVMERFPGHAAAYFLAARTLIHQGRPDRAIGYARDGFARDSRTAKDILSLADLLIEQGFYAEAVDVLALALNGDFRLAEVHTKIADAFEKMGDPLKAEEARAKAAALTDDEEAEEIFSGEHPSAP